jgi:hypothetical protein
MNLLYQTSVTLLCDLCVLCGKFFSAGFNSGSLGALQILTTEDTEVHRGSSLAKRF